MSKEIKGEILSYGPAPLFWYGKYYGALPRIHAWKVRRGWFEIIAEGTTEFFFWAKIQIWWVKRQNRKSHL